MGEFFGVIFGVAALVGILLIPPTLLMVLLGVLFHAGIISVAPGFWISLVIWVVFSLLFGGSKA